MEKMTLALLAVLLLEGCSNSVKDLDSATSKVPPVKVDTAELAAQRTVTESVPTRALADSSMDAAARLAAVFREAKACDKRVIVYLGAPWCGWCKRLEKFFDTYSSLFEDDYIILKIDVEEMERGDEVATRLRRDRTGGIPWITILNADGAELVTSDGPEGNIGCPVTEAECAYFVSMIEKTIRHAPEGRGAEIAEALEVFAKEKRR